MSLFSGIIEKKRRADQWLKDHPSAGAGIRILNIVFLGVAILFLARAYEDVARLEHQQMDPVVGELQRLSKNHTQIMYEAEYTLANIKGMRNVPESLVSDMIGRFSDLAADRIPRPIHPVPGVVAVPEKSRPQE